MWVLSRAVVREQRRPRRIGRALALLFALALLVASPMATRAAGDEQLPLRFGVFPYLPPLTLDQVFRPVVADLADAVGGQIDLRTKDTFGRFRDALATGSYDLVLVHPFFYVYAADAAGYEALARLDQDLVAVLLARPDQPVHEVEQLRGKVLGLPDELSAVSAIIKVALADHGLRPGQDVGLHHFSSKFSCLHAATVGSVAACGVPRFVLDQLETERELGLRVFYEAPPSLHFVLAVHPRVPEDDCIRIRKRVLAWTDSAKGRRMLRARGWQGFVAASDADYDEVRALWAEAEHVVMRR